LNETRSFTHLLSSLIERRKLPPLRWRAVLAGLAVAVIVVVLARTLVAPIPGIVATILGVAIGGYVAGKWAEYAGIYHGAVVGAAWVAFEALGPVPGASYSDDVLTDTVIIMAIDVATLVAAAIGGWLARPGPSSSSGTGKAR
jgi:hypothetical protein